jgi:hypothetical protein
VTPWIGMVKRFVMDVDIDVDVDVVNASYLT